MAALREVGIVKQGQGYMEYTGLAEEAQGGFKVFMGHLVHMMPSVVIAGRSAPFARPAASRQVQSAAIMMPSVATIFRAYGCMLGLLRRSAGS